MPHADRDRRLAYQKKWRDGRKEKKAAYDHEYREKNYSFQRENRSEYAKRDYVKDRKAEYQKRKADKFSANLRIIREAQGCRDCGRRDGRLIHHHIYPSTKVYNVSGMFSCTLESLFDTRLHREMRSE